MSTAADLNARFSLDRAVEFREGDGDLPYARLLHHSGSCIEIHLQGAHVTSWIIPGGDDLLYLSEKADFKQGKAIRGGIPIIFPQFSDRGPLPRHGFARTQLWEVIEAHVCEFQIVHLTLHLQDNEETRAVWPHNFSAEIEISLSEKDLTMQFKVNNRGNQAFACQTLFHNYFRLSDIARARVCYLQNCKYLDHLRDDAEERQPDSDLQITSAIDSIYCKTPDYILLRDLGCRRLMRILSFGLDDTVVWNPGEDECRKMQDMPDEGYRDMLCVEPGNVIRPKLLGPGLTWQAGQRLSYDHY